MKARYHSRSKSSRRTQSPSRLPVGLLVSVISLVEPLSSSAQTQDSTIVGKWHTPCSISLDSAERAIHVSLAHTGQVVMWTKNPDVNPGASALKVRVWNSYPTEPAGDYNPCSHQLDAIDYPGQHEGWMNQYASVGCTFYAGANTMLFCAGHTFLPDGTLLVAGGGELGFNPSRVHGGVYRLNLQSGTWTQEEELNKGFYYPSLRLDKNGNVLLLGGENCTMGEPLNTVHEGFLASQGWVELPEDPNSAEADLNGSYPVVNILTWPNSALNGSVSIIGGQGLHRECQDFCVTDPSSSAAQILPSNTTLK
jgi:hypothetical protein